MNIIKKTSTHNTTVAKGRNIKYLAIHYTAGVTSKQGAARNTASWFMNAAAGGSADFIVDDVECVQYNPDLRNRYCWAVGDKARNPYGGSLRGEAKNINAISIEICSSSKDGKVHPANDQNWYFTDAVVDRAVELTKYLMKEYNISPANVVRHFDCSSKYCPGIIGWNSASGDSSRWYAFKERIGGTAISVSNGSDSLLKKGSRGDTVKVMQTLLIKEGYSCGSAGADGIFGNDTLFALKSFQQDHGLTADGIYGPKSKAALEAANPSQNTTVLRKGDKGDAVRMMQAMLIACGYPCGKTGVDGDFGNKTKDALMRFQKDHGVAVDGLYGPQSRASLTQAYLVAH